MKTLAETTINYLDNSKSVYRLVRSTSRLFAVKCKLAGHRWSTVYTCAYSEAARSVYDAEIEDTKRSHSRRIVSIQQS